MKQPNNSYHHLTKYLSLWPLSVENNVTATGKIE